MSELKYQINDESELNGKMSDVYHMAKRGLAGGPVEVTLGRPGKKRSLDQNARLWAVLKDVSDQVEWYGRHLPSHAWKDIFTSALERHDIVPGIQGEFVMIGGSTSKMTKARFAELLTLIDAFGVDHNVKWSDPALEAFDHYMDAAGH